MKFVIQPGRLAGDVLIPGSKSHTIRGLILGALAAGESVLHRPLDSSDTQSGRRFVEALGARVAVRPSGSWSIRGVGAAPRPTGEPIDVGNSGTTLFLGMGAAALGPHHVELTGDEQIQQRSAEPLLQALSALGATAYSRGGNGCAPLVVGGGIRGGRVAIECPTSQYLSALLIACPLAEGPSLIEAPLLYEKPYVEMTLQWLTRLGVELDGSEDCRRFAIPGRQQVRRFEVRAPADFSTATFFMLAAAVCGGTLTLRGLDMTDAQGDRAVVGMLQAMGCRFRQHEQGLSVTGPDRLRGGVFDLNATPDALPAMAVAGALAQGETRLVNVPQARIKETDRIHVMAEELGRMGARIEELDDGLVIAGGTLHGAELHGHGDHRVVMALAVAGLAAHGTTQVDTAEAAAVTFPGFEEAMRGIGACIDLTPRAAR